MEKFRKQKKDGKKSKNKPPEKSSPDKPAEYCEEEVYREINSRSFGDNFTILIQHYKKQLEMNPPKIKVP